MAHTVLFGSASTGGEGGGRPRDADSARPRACRRWGWRATLPPGARRRRVVVPSPPRGRALLVHCALPSALPFLHAATREKKSEFFFYLRYCLRRRRGCRPRVGARGEGGRGGERGRGQGRTTQGQERTTQEQERTTQEPTPRSPPPPPLPLLPRWREPAASSAPPLAPTAWACAPRAAPPPLGLRRRPSRPAGRCEGEGGAPTTAPCPCASRAPPASPAWRRPTRAPSPPRRWRSQRRRGREGEVWREG